jgi:tartrate-resistant acid phosphatase type 5
METLGPRPDRNSGLSTMQDILLNRREVITSIAGAAALTAVPAALRAASPAVLPFLVVGDWGRNGASHQRDVAAQMGKTAESLGSRCVISVGDNFYEDGVQSASDPQWRSSFEDIYSARSLQIPWYVALGNHDYRGVPQAQIDYARSSARWRMPSRYYKVAGTSLGAPHLDLFLIDTSPLVHKYRDNVHSAIAQNVASQDVQAQLHWLDEQLGRSTAAWKLVIGHHTIYSGGSGHGDTPETQELIEPLLRKHRVQAYINGHDHDMQHIRRDGVDYVCCGAGSEVRPVQAIEGTLFCKSVSGFAAIVSDPDTLNVEFRDFTGASLYRSAIPRRGTATGKAAA